jgi:hypothetical protein
MADEMIAISDRINWLVSFNAIFRRKTLEELTEYGTEFGTHLLRPFKTRFQGRDAYGHNSWIRVTDPHTGKVSYKQNFINYNVESFLVEERQTYQQIINRLQFQANLQNNNANNDNDI